jgi:hypothetical protein
MTDSNIPWPSAYNVGPRDHLHALGVISNNYNEFESELFMLFSHHLQIPQSVYELFYFSTTECKRLEFIKETFASLEKDSEVTKCVIDLIAYFQWCSEVRNTLLHAMHSPPFFGEPQEGKLYLSKRNKHGSNLNYMKVSLPEALLDR